MGLGRGFFGNELILEFLAKSMPSGFQRRGDPGSWTAFRLGTSPIGVIARFDRVIQYPELAVTGWHAQDKLLPVRYADVWRTEVPGAKVEIIPACGHLLHVEKAEMAANRILAFTDGDSR
jgi:pimeloyl-ACP methyl ester carboxylesterase